MTQIKITPYEPGDLQAMELREHERVVLNAEKLEALMSQCVAITVWAVDESIDDVMPIAALAYTPVVAGLYDVFLIPTVYLPQFAFSIVRIVRKYLDRLEQDLPEFRRLQTYSLGDNQTDKWMRALGFTQEGIHRKYAPDGSTYHSWARIA